MEAVKNNELEEYEKSTKDMINAKVLGQIESIKRSKESILKHSALLLTLLTVIAYSLIYAYYVEYAKYFSIPATCISIDLGSHAHYLVYIVMTIMYVLSYAYEYLAEKVNCTFKFRISRIIKLAMLFLILYPLVFSKTWYISLICIFVPVFIEACLYFKNTHIAKKRKKGECEAKEVPKVDIYERGRRYVNGKLLTYSKPLFNYIIIYLLAYLVFSMTGHYKASIEKNFSIIQNVDKINVVIFDYMEKVVVVDGIN